MIRSSSLRWPITLGVILLALITALLVFWIIGQASNQQWALLIVGTIFFALVLIGVVMYLILTIKEVRLTRRQANFIDSVTHELKSPIASLKLCLQTLDLRDVGPEQQREFHKFMLDDVQRLDSLIDHLLIAARLDHLPQTEFVEEIAAGELVQTCLNQVSRQHPALAEAVELQIEPCVIQGNRRDLEIVFVNLLDNAAKYGGQPLEVKVQIQPRGPKRVLIKISDNGKGVRYELRRKIFQRFERGGSELERTTQGTGLGLYLVKSLVSKMRGKISVHGWGQLWGATFEVELPGRAWTKPAELPAPAAAEQLPGSPVVAEESPGDGHEETHSDR